MTGKNLHSKSPQVPFQSSVARRGCRVLLADLHVVEKGWFQSSVARKGCRDALPPVFRGEGLKFQSSVARRGCRDSDNQGRRLHH